MAGFLPLLLGLGTDVGLSYVGAERRRRRDYEDERAQKFDQELDAEPWKVYDSNYIKEGKQHFGRDWDQKAMGWQADAAAKQRDLHVQLDQIKGTPFEGILGLPLKMQLEKMRKAGAPVPTDVGSATSMGGVVPPMPPVSANAGLSGAPMQGGLAGTPATATGGAPAGIPAPAVNGGAPSVGSGPSMAPTPTPSMSATAPSGPASSSAASMAPAQPQKLEDMSVSDLRTLDMNFDAIAGNSVAPEQLKAMHSNIQGIIKDKEKQGEAQKPPAELNALSQAYFGGRGYAELSPDEKKQAQNLAQQRKEDPSIKAFARAQDEWDRRQAKRDADQKVAQDKKDAESRRKHGLSIRSSVVSFNQRQNARRDIIAKSGQSQEQQQASIDALNADADAQEESIRQSIANDEVPDDFKYPNIVRYSMDPATGNWLERKTGLAMTAGTIKAIDPLIGKSTSKADGDWYVGSKKYKVKSGKIVGAE